MAQLLPVLRSCQLRLVSLCPSMTHTLFQLGLGADLVGVTRFCIEPAEGVAHIEKVGGTKNPNLEKIRALAPDLVFFNREENRREDWEQLTEAGIDCHISYPVDVPSTCAMLRDLGQRLASEDKAAELLHAVKREQELLEASKPAGADLSWAYLIWRKPYMAVGRATYIHGLLAEVAPHNVFKDVAEPYPETSVEDLLDRQPDRVLLSSEPFPFKTKHIQELMAATGWAQDRFQLVDGQRLSWHGAMTPAGLAYARTLFTTA